MTDREIFLTSFQKKLGSEFHGTQNWWTKSLFHFSDILNAISILENASVYSRNRALELNLMQNDNANNDVIALTSDEHKNYARLYFGPSTPTQKNNEGVKPISEISNEAHCPIPVMFIFDFKKVFMLDGVLFTDGNLATNPIIYDDIHDLESLNFHMIYHRTWFTPEHRNKIINARHSEVLVKDALQLENNLRLIAVRSEAEKETLLYQLSTTLKEKYNNKIYVQPQTGIFINDWLYVDKVSLLNDTIHVEWHKCSNSISCNNQYNLKIVARNEAENIVKTLAKNSWYPKDSTQKINLTEELKNIEFELEIYIDEIKVYVNKFGGIIV